MNHATHSRAAPVEVAAAAKRTRSRFGILALLAIGTMINYLDRSVAGIARRA
jgi:ACS family D-galactonate transporter-like MFS transporter